MDVNDFRVDSGFVVFVISLVLCFSEGGEGEVLVGVDFFGF